MPGRFSTPTRHRASNSLEISVLRGKALRVNLRMKRHLRKVVFK